jgi:rhodanese-related sulfurtransferase
MNANALSAAPANGDSVAPILARAAVRAREARLPYAGAVTPVEAYRLAELGAATIVDVRTRPEWEFVGRIEGACLVEWRAWGATEPHPDFVENVASQFAPERPLLLLCRSGVRSHHAAEALARAGFGHSYNILQGFEGDRDAQGRRSTLGGWRFAGLPWTQG